MTSPIGNVIERKSPSRPSNTQCINPLASKNGFPIVDHRARASAFKRARQNHLDSENKSNSRESALPLRDASLIFPGGSRGNNRDFVPDLRQDISRSNDELLEGMTEEQRRRERQDVLEYFGPGIEKLVQNVKQARERRLTRDVG